MEHDDGNGQGMDRRGFLEAALAGAGALALGPGGALAAEASATIPMGTLGRTGAKVPRLIAGTAMPLSLPYIKRAYDLGVTAFDLADCYSGGGSERVMGDFLKRTGLRDKMFLISKSCPHDWKTAEATLETSLTRLGTDHLDLFFLHNLEDPGKLDGAMKQHVEQWKRKGKTRFFGFSTHAPRLIENLEKAAQVGWVDAILFKYNFRDYDDARLNKAIDACKKADIGLISMKTQGSAFSFLQRVKPFQAEGYTPHQAVLKAVWADQRIDASVSHMQGFEQLEQNVAAAQDRMKLGKATLERLHRHADETRHLYCRGCEHLCVPGLGAPVALADVMRLVMYHDEYGQKELARSLFAAIPPELRRLRDVDFSPAARACPRGIDVPRVMARAAEFLDVQVV